MPYVPSKKTDGKSTDRERLDAIVNILANESAEKITTNLSLIKIYDLVFRQITEGLRCIVNRENCMRGEESFEYSKLFACCKLTASSIYDVGKKYDYEGAYLGELNYAMTRFIQRVPQIMVERGIWKDELRYWVYAATVEALTCTAYYTRTLGIGVSGVFEDIKDEYKRRVNPAYEAAQIIKSGDCYDTPYYTRLVEVVDEDGNLVGHQEVMLKRSEATLKQDLLDGCFVLTRKPQKPAEGGA